MDYGGTEDMLFSAIDSQESFGNLWDEDSDDKLHGIADTGYDTDDDLFGTPMSTASESWQPLGSPSSTPTQLVEKQYGITTSDENSTVLVNDVLPSMNTVGRISRDRHWVIARIEAMLERIVDALLEGDERLTFTLKSRAGISRRQQNPKEDVSEAPVPKERDISFPGNTAQEAWNFTVFLRIIELIHGGLVDDTIMTKRDIYYRHPDLFVKQSVVDRYVDDLACTFDISRSQLNVTAAAKGLVAGCFTISREDGTQVDGMNDKEGLLVPKIQENDRLDLSQVRWVLIIEKEATFRSLLSTVQWEIMCLYGLALTAKGYPDIATRRFLRHLADHAPHIPMHAFVDLDPDGVAILSTYKYGSYRLAHEDVAPKDTPALSLPNLRWLGVKRHHISRIPVDESDTNTSAMTEFQGLMRLTARDRTKATRMLEWNLCTEDGPEKEWRHELQAMLILNIKAEMQILDELPGGMVSFLGNELDGTGEAMVDATVDMECSDDGLLF